ncbi:MAG TPA: Re/Si-specific NAD(P)(+) transhydrogenase subunit alpha [Gemmatimonadetes bacterium]|nr:Re/Si-specific NAD(P)(+) transhydrogenase subunit alpha [Gemmatimonadota bacterium]|tara:strand:- start:1186 stop:2358 length:1173 start_codon:yes stop_codon:yes gene_type:complete
MKIAIPKETHHGEQRVALAPEACKKLVKAGFTVAVEAGAGESAFFPDDAYRQVGAGVESDGAQLLGSADFVLKVNPPTAGGASGRDEVAWMRPGTLLLASIMPVRNLDVVRALAGRQVTAFSTDAIPRISRAQAMDTLSSMANIAGYKGVLIAATELNKYFPMLMTAAGMVPPAKVFVIGAAVAGLQAIATAKRLGANVSATDVRPEVKEQIESVGGKYVGIELKESAVAGGGYAKELSEEDQARQRELLVEQCAAVDVVITTALIGGIFAPKLLDRKIVSSMRKGSVIVDLAADGGGNCELSRPGETVVEEGVTIVAPLNLASTMPTHASLLFSRNVTAFLMAFAEGGKFNLDLGDEIQEGALITHEGEVRHARTKEALEKSAGGIAVQ